MMSLEFATHRSLEFSGAVMARVKKHVSMSFALIVLSLRDQDMSHPCSRYSTAKISFTKTHSKTTREYYAG